MTLLLIRATGTISEMTHTTTGSCLICIYTKYLVTNGGRWLASSTTHILARITKNCENLTPSCGRWWGSGHSHCRTSCNATTRNILLNNKLDPTRWPRDTFFGLTIISRDGNTGVLITRTKRDGFDHRLQTRHNVGSTGLGENGRRSVTLREMISRVRRLEGKIVVGNVLRRKVAHISLGRIGRRMDKGPGLVGWRRGIFLRMMQ